MGSFDVASSGGLNAGHLFGNGLLLLMISRDYGLFLLLLEAMNQKSLETVQTNPA